MPRGRRVPPRVVSPDPKYNSELIGKFTNFLMERGKKNIARAIMYGALNKVEEVKKENALQLFEKAVEIIRPQVEVRSRRVGGANYQVPVPVPQQRQNALAFRWIITAARARKGKCMEEKLSLEILDIIDGVGGAIKKKEDVIRMAEANKAFAHFARFRSKK